MADAALLDRARTAYAQRDWVSARDAFTRAAPASELAPDDARALADCSWWLGDLAAAFPAMEHAFDRYLAEERSGAAGLVALDIAYTFLLRGEEARGSGWLQRSVELLEALPDCRERGYLTHVEFEMAFGQRDLAAAEQAAIAVGEHGRRYGDETLSALSLVGRGRVLLQRGRVGEGIALLDQAMVAAVSDRLDPGWAGNIYCHLMVACHDIADLRRAGEWTEATARWCEAMPGAGPFLGICRVHRAQVLQVRGAWGEAQGELERVRTRHADFSVAVVAEAHYLLGEVRRLQGDLDGAEREHLVAHHLGRDPQPGTALVALARGRVGAARASLRTALAAAGGDPLARGHLLPAAVEIELAAGDREAARACVEELEALASTYETTGFAAEAGGARARLLLAEGRAEAAVAVIAETLRCWHQLDAPFEVARLRLLRAEACEALGDADGAAREREAARDARVRLGVRAPLPGPVRRARADGLTPREVEVLERVAAGRSNQEIAEELVLSVRTVERHLTTVYRKLDLHGPTARAGAVAYALRGELPTS